MAIATAMRRVSNFVGGAEVKRFTTDQIASIVMDQAPDMVINTV